LIASASALVCTAVAFAIVGLYADAFANAAIAAILLTSLHSARLAYLSGWFRGRSAMLASLEEANRRGLSASEWVVGEMERDLALMPRRRRRRRRGTS
jgi:hypothetical protein